MKKLVLLLVALSVGMFGCGNGSGGGGISYFQSGTFEKTVSPAQAYFNTTITAPPNTDDTTAVTITPQVSYYSNALNKLPFSIRNIVYKYTKTTDSNYVITDTGSTYISLPDPIPYIVATAGIKNKIYNKGFVSGDEFILTADFTVVEEGTDKSEVYTNVYLAKVRFQ